MASYTLLLIYPQFIIIALHHIIISVPSHLISLQLSLNYLIIIYIVLISFRFDFFLSLLSLVPVDDDVNCCANCNSPQTNPLHLHHLTCNFGIVRANCCRCSGIAIIPVVVLVIHCGHAH